MSSARIYQPAKDASQSGPARNKGWVLEFDQSSPREIDPLMGWTGSSDMLQQVRLEFETRDEAIAYASRAGLSYRVEEPQKPVPRKGLSYSDNFKFNRTAPWTH
ncbi:ETC complex I subunit [Methylobacterium gossipiicola]|uniref:ETC complex I subunit conserved region n=1 Tax=Methylobacterium gossipiicola TaxID=582675 RepID=A0A1I2QMV7_9HYPH|nr:ETC complex I subunit [Methylobacterium gossipiicola]SFG29714.1 ETC complex I subunit conserved region [Methylobacterium gossipiicola]